MGSEDTKMLDSVHLTPMVTLVGSNFMVDDHVILSNIPSNITTRYTASNGCFVGFNAIASTSRHVVPIGKLNGIRFMSLFRFKAWWTTQWVGSHGRDLEHETQMLMLEKSDSGRPYVLILPLLEGPFRACLQSGKDDFIDVCVESGSTKVHDTSFRSIIYMHAGYDPYAVIKKAMKVVQEHLGTFKLLEEKTLPGIIDKFGWCTWDSFYLAADPKGVFEGVKVLVEGGCPPGLVLLDDGWQSVSNDNDPIDPQGMINITNTDARMACRLTEFIENYKFRDYESSKPGHPNKGMGAFVRDLKEEFKSVDYVYVWQALCGYWGGVRPDIFGLKSRVVQPILSPALENTMEDLAGASIVKYEIGLVPPEKVDQLFDGLHSYLKSVGIDGVKIDVIHLLEMLSEDYGGRVELEKAYYQALTASVKKHFKGNGVIASMELCNDFTFLGTESISVGRVGDDFWCTDDPNGTFWLQGHHIVDCAYNSLWIGNFLQPDWDLFQSTHPCAEYHAASRAISGGPIYISDTVGKHNFDLLKTLVLPDGSTLRCQFHALPTRDCLFEDPLHDGKTMLKLWNLNKYTGVIGAFNCQGGGWSRELRSKKSNPECSRIVTSTISPIDVEWQNGKAPQMFVVDTFALYLFRQKKLILAKSSDRIELSLEPFNFELITISPVTILANKLVQFAPIGLVNMLNSGGSIQSVAYVSDSDGSCRVQVGVKGTGEMVVFASEKPSECHINGGNVDFKYEEHIVVVQVPWSTSLCTIEYVF